MNYAIGAQPTPLPQKGVNSTPQLTGGQIYNDTAGNDWTAWNQGWNEGYNNPNGSYTGTNKDWGSGYLQGQQEYAKRNSTSITQPKADNSKLPAATPTPTNNGMSYSDQGLIDEYKRRGWTDLNAILASIRAGDYKGWGVTGGTGGVDKTKSSNNDPRANDVLSNPNANADFEASGMNMDEYLATIDQEADNVNKLYDQTEATLRAQQPGIEQGIRDQAGNLISKATRVKEDAQAAARRLYGELQQGYKQRFGGASSAGEAAMALTGNEQQRQMAQNNRTFQETVANVDLSANEAIRSAQSEFSNQLLEINRNRTATEGERLAARRGALQNLADKVFQIKQQATTFKQNLALMQEQARLQNEANLKSMSINPTSTLTTNNASATASGNQGLNTIYQSIGKTSAGISKDKDLLAQGIYPIATMTDGRKRYSDGSVR